MNCRTLFVSLLLVAVSVNVHSAERFQFEKLDAPYKVTMMASSPDHGQLYVAHESENKITVWDTDTCKLIREVECAAPRFILCRGERVYVANFGRGTISVFDAQGRLVNQVESGVLEANMLSAPDERHFEEKLLVSGRGEGQKYLVNVIDVKRDEHREILNGAYMLAAYVNHDGRYVLLQSTLGGSPSGKITAIQLKSSLGERQQNLGGEHHGKRTLSPL